MKKKIDLTGIEEAGVILTQVESRHRKGLINVIHVVGLPGTGKSWGCIRLGELISERLHGKNEMTSKRIVDNLLDLLKFIRQVKKRGEVVVVEEAGVLFDSRRAMSGENVDAGKIFDTLRKKGVIVIMNNPISRDLDSKLVRLSTLMLQTVSLNKTEERVLIKPLRLQTNPDTGKTYRHRLKQDGKEVHRCWLGKPNEETTNEYEQMKDSFLNNLYDVLVAKQEKKKEKVMQELRVRLGGLRRIPQITDNENKRYNYRNTGMRVVDIAKIEGVTPKAVDASIRSYKEKIKKLEKLNSTLPIQTPTHNLTMKAQKQELPSIA